MLDNVAVYYYQSMTKRPVIARSYCEIEFESEERLLQCVEALKASDEKMSQRPEEAITYEWDAGIQTGKKLQFGVKWYDREFFEKKKEIYNNSLHEHVFSKFGAKIGDFKVNHYMPVS